MSKSTVIPKVPSANDLHALCRIHDENEDRQTSVSLDNLTPHARAALERLIGKAHDPD